MGGLIQVRASKKESGFTVVELLIATAVFSVVLLMMTFGILQVTNTFFKGDNESNTQRVAAIVLNTVAQAVEFNGGKAQQVGNTWCFGGSEQISFWQGIELEQNPNPLKDQGASAFVENVGSCDGTRSSTGRELLSDNMRLSNLSITCISTAALCSSSTDPGALYQINVRIVYGDDDLVYSPSGAPISTAKDTACNGKLIGEQFCAVSDVSTIVSERL